MREFVSGSLKYYPNIIQAIEDALNKLPDEVYEKVTHRARPIIFVNSISSGIARFAHSTQFVMEPGDPPTFTDGFYLIILGDELDGQNTAAIEGIILHETAHRYLDHLSRPASNCDMEREANRLIKSWGYEEEYKAASQSFGAKQKGDSPCADEMMKESRD
jgi:hypothetical protein